MSILGRTRGALLRIVRNRPRAIAIGLALVIAAVAAQAYAVWWLQGLSLLVGATGAALLWTGLTGAAPDWVDDTSQSSEPEQ